jgi:hypothetical protein
VGGGGWKRRGWRRRCGEFAGEGDAGGRGYTGDARGGEDTQVMQGEERIHRLEVRIHRLVVRLHRLVLPLHHLHQHI